MGKVYLIIISTLHIYIKNNPAYKNLLMKGPSDYNSKR